MASVSPSVTLVICVITVKCIIEICHHLVATSYSFLSQISWRNSDRIILVGDVIMRKYQTHTYLTRLLLCLLPNSPWNAMGTSDHPRNILLSF